VNNPHLVIIDSTWYDTEDTDNGTFVPLSTQPTRQELTERDLSDLEAILYYDSLAECDYVSK
jgi:hypothetical protein